MPETRSDLVPVTPLALASVEVLTAHTVDDEHAISTFLHMYSGRDASSHTLRSYTKECKRFLLWIRSRRGLRPSLLPEVTLEDINDYIGFMAEPREFSKEFLQANGWKHQPFRKALTRDSIALSMSVLNHLYVAMYNMRGPGERPYCTFNPVYLAQKAPKTKKKINKDEEVEEALSAEEWIAVQEAIEALPRDTVREQKHYHRVRWIVNLLYRAFLRREEAAELQMKDFEASAKGWSLRVDGKGNKVAKIIATAKLIDELKLYRLSLGLPPLPRFNEDRPAILAVVGTDKGVTAQAIYLICKEIFRQAAQRIEPTNPVSAHRLMKASPHWLRHTGVSHSMESGIDPRYVQAQARHSSLVVTARYDHKDRHAWRNAFDDVDKGGASDQTS